MSTGVEVVVSELHQAQVNVIPALFSGKASNHQPDCDLRRLRLAFESTEFLDDDEREAVRLLLDAFLAHHGLRHGDEGPRGPRSKRS